MSSLAHVPPTGPRREDHIVVLRGLAWSDLQRLLEARGDTSGPRFAYLEGSLEIMSPSRSHEAIKSLIGRLVEVWCLEHDITFDTLGSWTLEDKAAERAVEPDECYVFGDEPVPRTRPHLAIEVVWSHGGLPKLAIYQGLGVHEVWFWKGGALTAHVLRDGRYVAIEGSEVLAGIDLEVLASFLDRKTSDAIRAYRRALRGASPR